MANKKDMRLLFIKGQNLDRYHIDKDTVLYSGQSHPFKLETAKRLLTDFPDNFFQVKENKDGTVTALRPGEGESLEEAPEVVENAAKDQLTPEENTLLERAQEKVKSGVALTDDETAVVDKYESLVTGAGESDG